MVIMVYLLDLFQFKKRNIKMGVCPNCGNQTLVPSFDMHVCTTCGYQMSDK
jgi:Zn ribbon nucleic-acid-binding protein